MLGVISELKLHFLPGNGQPTILLRVSNEPEIAQVSTIRSSSGNNVTFVSMGSQRTALEFALGAAAAIAIARYEKTSIKDQALFFSPKLEQSPTEFCDILRVREPCAGYREAANEFGRKLRI